MSPLRVAFYYQQHGPIEMSPCTGMLAYVADTNGVVICGRKKNVSSKGDILLPATWAGRHAGTLAHVAGSKMSPFEETFF